jgi:WD40 repeat protein
VKATLIKAAKGHAAAVYCMWYNERERRLYTGSADRMVGSWNTENFEPDSFSVNVGAPVFSIRESGPRLLIGQGEGGIHVIDRNEKKELRHLKYHSRPVFEIIENREGSHFYSLGGDGLLSIISAEDFELLWSLPLSEDKLRTAILSADGKRLLVGGSDGYIRILETEYFNVLNEFRAHEGGVYDMLFTADGTLLTCGRDGHLRYRNFTGDSAEELEAIPAHNYAIYCIESSPDGRLFASASRDKTVKIWDLSEPTKPLRIARRGPLGHTHSVNVVKWLSDELLVSAGDDRDLHFWSISKA